MVSQTVYFTGMMVFTITSQMYRWKSVLVPVLVRVPEYLPKTSTSTSTSTFIWNSRVRAKYEYQKFSTRVLRVGVLSTSIPALIDRHGLGCCNPFKALPCQLHHVIPSIYYLLISSLPTLKWRVFNTIPELSWFIVILCQCISLNQRITSTWNSTF